MANRVLQYFSNVCKLNFSKCRGHSYDNAANMSGRYKGMQQNLLETNNFDILKNKNVLNVLLLFILFSYIHMGAPTSLIRHARLLAV